MSDTPFSEGLGGFAQAGVQEQEAKEEQARQEREERARLEAEQQPEESEQIDVTIEETTENVESGEQGQEQGEEGEESQEHEGQEGQEHAQQGEHGQHGSTQEQKAGTTPPKKSEPNPLSADQQKLFDAINDKMSKSDDFSVIFTATDVSTVLGWVDLAPEDLEATRVHGEENPEIDQVHEALTNLNRAVLGYYVEPDLGQDQLKRGIKRGTLTPSMAETALRGEEVQKIILILEELSAALEHWPDPRQAGVKATVDNRRQGLTMDFISLKELLGTLGTLPKPDVKESDESDESDEDEA